MKKRISEQLNLIADPVIRERAIANFKKQRLEDIKVYGPSEAIDYGFNWQNTPEEGYYWHDVYYSKIELPSEPQSTMVDGLDLKWVRLQDWCPQKWINDYWYTFDDKGVERQITDAELLTQFQNRA